MTSRKTKQIRVLFLFIFFNLFGAIATADEAARNVEKTKEKRLDYIAIVGGEKITLGEYVSALRGGMRQRFYHGKAPEGELKKYYKEVAEELVDRALKIQEAKRRGIKPDVAAVDKAVNDFDAKLKGNSDWEKERDSALPKVREKFAGDSFAKMLEDQVKAVDEPGMDELQVYYDSHRDLFTTPAQAQVSMIMLKVDPSSPSAAWEQARTEAVTIVDRLRKGADFAELARIHSSDSSAQNGGDMGFIHTGMLGEQAQQVLDIMEKGEVSSPVVLLEGVAIFRLDDRREPRLNSLEAVKERAAALLRREKSEQQWKDLMLRLRSETEIVLNDAPWR